MNRIFKFVAGCFFGIIYISFSNFIFCMPDEQELREVEDAILLALENNTPAFTTDFDSDEIESLNLIDLTFDAFCKIKFSFNLFKIIADNFIMNRLIKLTDTFIWEDYYSPFSQFTQKLVEADNWQKFLSNQHLYAHKLFVKPNSKAIVFSDIHGNIQTLITLINSWIALGFMNQNLILRDDIVLIGVGDYMDRGGFSLEVISTLMLIALKNPRNIILLRGNHECLAMNITTEFNINKEIENSCGPLNPKIVYRLLIQIYELMPSILYFGETPRHSTNKLLAFSHGLFDFKYDPGDLLDLHDDVIRYYGGERFEIISQNLWGYGASLEHLGCGEGFVWHDIRLDNDKTVELEAPSTRCKYSPSFVATFCKEHSTQQNQICGLIGGHQHNLAKTICNVECEAYTPAACFVGVDDYDKVSYGIIDPGHDNRFRFSTYFPIIKVISSPIDLINYKPTYLIVTKDEMGWCVESVECD